MKEVCRGDGGGNRDGWVGGGGGGLLVGVSASELEPMKSETGQARAGDAVTATHSTRLGLMSSTSRSWHKLCLPHTHTHTRMHTHKVNVIYVHYTITAYSAFQWHLNQRRQTCISLPKIKKKHKDLTEKRGGFFPYVIILFTFDNNQAANDLVFVFK